MWSLTLPRSYSSPLGNSSIPCPHGHFPLPALGIQVTSFLFQATSLDPPHSSRPNSCLIFSDMFFSWIFKSTSLKFFALYHLRLCHSKCCQMNSSSGSWLEIYSQGPTSEQLNLNLQFCKMPEVIHKG